MTAATKVSVWRDWQIVVATEVNGWRTKKVTAAMEVSVVFEAILPWRFGRECLVFSGQPDMGK